MLNNYKNFTFKLILEELGEIEMYYSDRFRSIIKQISDSNNHIAKRLLIAEGDLKKKVFIDIDDNTIDGITFLISNKAVDLFGSDHNYARLNRSHKKEIYSSNQRVPMKINRFVNEVFNNEYKTKRLSDEEKKYNRENNIITAPKQLEDFVNQYKTIREPGNFELISGEDVRFWYSGDNYYTNNGTLGASCMKDDDCQEFLDFYVDNDDIVSMLIMKSRKDDDTIIGRALVWELTEPSGRTFMDRIYTNYEHDTVGFKNYAKEQGWIYKLNQNMKSDEELVDTITDTTQHINLLINKMGHYNETFPYLDTLKYYDTEKEMLSNITYNLEKHITLEETDGGPLANTMTYEELVERYVDEIQNDIEYFVTNIFSADDFWNFIDDERYIENYIEGEIEYYYSEFIHIFETEEVVEYLKDHVEHEKLPDDLDDLDDLDLEELRDLLEEHSIFDDYLQSYAEGRYSGYSAKDLHEEMYGNVDTINSDTYNQYQHYFDEEEYAKEMGGNEDEDYLRERYQDE